MGETPHSVAAWIVLEIHQRRPDGSLSGMPVSQKNCTGIINCPTKEKSEEILKVLVDEIHKVIENAKTSLV